MPHSSVFIEIMICAIYGQKCKHPKNVYGIKSLNVSTVKLFSNSLTFFRSFDAFLFLYLSTKVVTNYEGPKAQ